MKAKLNACIIFLAIVALPLLSLAGCSNNQRSVPNSSQTYSGSNTNNLSSTGISESSAEKSEDNSFDDNASSIPNGEPTFLICPDGTPVYTSEISEIYSESGFEGGKETLTLAQAEQYARAGEGEFTVECEGFSYGFIPERALTRADDPEMFKGNGSGTSFEFLGDEDKPSADYTRIKVGDKFETLTVKSACTIFSDDRLLENLSETPGAYISGGSIAFDGEVELTGYVEVWNNPDYPDSVGIMVFYPDGDSSVKIPVISFAYSEDYEKIHQRKPSSVGYFGDWWCSLGNMYEVDCDTSDLRPGDIFVKVKITADNVTSGQGGVGLNLKSLEAI